jgi:transposase
MLTYTPQQKHIILTHYRAGDRSASLRALARRFAVQGGNAVILRWYQRWDGTPQSLETRKRSGRPRVLSKREVQQHVHAPLLRANRAHKQMHYSKLVPSVQEKTAKEVSARTVRRYGKEELGARKGRGKKRTAEESECTHTHNSESAGVCDERALTDLRSVSVFTPVSADMCEQIAKVRRKLQRIGTGHILFLDETLKREGDVDNYSLFLPGQPPFIETSSTSKYAQRYDMIACCSGHAVLPPIIYSPKERQKGIDTAMLLSHIRDLLAQAAGALDQYPLILVLDRATIHNEEKMMQEFHDWGCQELTEIVKMPPAAAKRLSPLDNSLFNLWRQRVLADGPLTKANIKQRMSDAWSTITAEEIHAQYKHCGLLRHQDVYFDCPDPAAHRHSR